MRSLEVSVVMPCLNEAQTLGICIDKALRTLEALDVSGEVVVADNGSTDGSQAIAGEHGARVVDVPLRGYGAALMGGIQAAAGTYVIMGDADDSYDFTALGPFIERLREGCDLVVGNRFQGGIRPGAMPPLHRYLGNPVLSFIGRLFFRTGIGDFHCGLRGFTREAALRMDLRTTGMEFASEMVVKASLLKMRIAEVPTTLSPDGRDRPPHLRSWRDGWRHLRFLLIFSPRWLFLYPGLALMAVGLIVGAILIGGSIARTNSLLLMLTLLISGLQSVFFAIEARIFGVQAGLLPESKAISVFQRMLHLESGLIMGALLILAGIGGYLVATALWIDLNFGAFPEEYTRNIVIPSTAALVIGMQTVLNFFLISMLRLEHFSKSAGHRR